MGTAATLYQADTQIDYRTVAEELDELERLECEADEYANVFDVKGNDRARAAARDAVELAFEHADAVRRMVEAHPDTHLLGRFNAILGRLHNIGEGLERYRRRQNGEPASGMMRRAKRLDVSTLPLSYTCSANLLPATPFTHSD